ncbi:MAG: FprA family A-type flavoprotein [Lachnospiraceae bacterium]|nr:FprA family A-type flavoprotein [Lachnospiraceae bacterium]
MMNVTSEIKYIGVNDYSKDLFEGLYKVPEGMAYNSYAIIDEKIAIMDTVDVLFTNQWLNNIEKVLGERKPDYLIVQHMEPDHSASVMGFFNRYPDTTLVASFKAFEMMVNYFGTEFEDRRLVIGDGDKLSLGRHKLIFTSAFMIHWPEVMMTYDSTDKVLFSADAFGRFGAIEAKVNWIDEARRYYFGIVGKYGTQVKKLLEKVVQWDIKIICPLHGVVLSENLQYFFSLYNTWASYEPEEEGVLIAFTSVYGNTEKAAMMLKDMLISRGYTKVALRNLIRGDISEAVADAFRYSQLVLATTTYNADIFPPMREFINSLIERNFSNRRVALIENGSWVPVASKKMREKFEKSKNLEFIESPVKILSVLSTESTQQLEKLADELSRKN